MGAEGDDDAGTDNEESQRRTQIEEEIWTPESAELVHANRREKRRQRRANREQPNAQPAIFIPLDLQEPIGKIVTGKSVYILKNIIAHGGDPMRHDKLVFQRCPMIWSSYFSWFLANTASPDGCGQYYRFPVDRSIH